MPAESSPTLFCLSVIIAVIRWVLTIAIFVISVEDGFFQLTLILLAIALLLGYMIFGKGMYRTPVRSLRNYSTRGYFWYTLIPTAILWVITYFLIYDELEKQGYFYIEEWLMDVGELD